METNHVKVKREDQQLVKQLSLSQRVAIESKNWDKWALSQQANQYLPSISGRIRPGIEISEQAKDGFPHPADFWISATQSCRRTSRIWELEYLSPVRGKVVLQLGGAGEYVIKFALAGALQGACVDPSVETLKLGIRRAALYGVLPKIQFARGIGERLPFPSESFDVVYGSAVLHHTLADETASEIYRVLRPGGRASFHDPLEGFTVARFGRKYLPYPGKGDEGVDYPLDYVTVRKIVSSFDGGEYRESELFGVPLKFARRLSPKLARLRVIEPFDEYLCGRYQSLRRFCSAVAIRVHKKS